MATKKSTINPNLLKSRDLLLLQLILGITKSGTQTDQKKERNKRKGRKKVRLDEEE